MVEAFLKTPPLNKTLEFQDWKKTAKLNQKKQKNFKPEIKLMIENLHDELYQLENKQTKGAKLVANIRLEMEGKKCLKNFFKVLCSWNQGQISIKLAAKHVI